MASGKFAGGDGSANNPFLIEDAFDLDAVRNGLDKHYKLIKDIDLDIAPFNEGQGWKPIGNPNEKFSGIIDGNGKIIKNLFIYSKTYNVGLLGFASNESIIKDIGVVNVNIAVSTNSTPSLVAVGGLVGRCEQGNIKRCFVTGIIRGGSSSYRCNTGGISGYGGIISNCYFLGKVESGITGANYLDTGGIVGEGGMSTYSNCYVIANMIKKGTGKNSTNIGAISGSTSGMYDKYIINCFYDNTSGNYNFGIGKTTEELKTPSTYIDWDKEKLEDGSPVWILKDGEYPKLWFEVSPNKFLIKQDSNYYSIKSNFYKIGQPSNTIQFNNWYNKYGVDDINIITQTLSSKEVIMTLDETTDIWQTDFELDVNNIIDDIELIENNDEGNYKIIKYSSPQYRILDELNDEFEIMMATDKT